LDRVYSSLAIQLRQICNLLTVNLRRSVSQSFVEGLAQDVDVAVFTKNERHNQPVIARAYLSIRASVAEKGAGLPSGNIRRMPRIVFRFLMKVRGLVPNVASSNDLAFANRLCRLADHHAVHNYLIAGRKVLQS